MKSIAVIVRDMSTGGDLFSYTDLSMPSDILLGSTSLIPNSPSPTTPSALVNNINANNFSYKKNGYLYKATLPSMRSAASFSDTWNSSAGVFTQNLGYREFDGTENWYKSTAWCYLSIGSSNTYNDIACISSHFTAYSGLYFQTNIATITQGCCLAGNSYAIRIKYGDGEVATLKNFLINEKAKGTPVKIVYLLNTPIVTRIRPVLVMDCS